MRLDQGPIEQHIDGPDEPFVLVRTCPGTKRKSPKAFRLTIPLQFESKVNDNPSNLGIDPQKRHVLFPERRSLLQPIMAMYKRLAGTLANFASGYTLHLQPKAFPPLPLNGIDFESSQSQQLKACASNPLDAAKNNASLINEA